MRRDEGIAPYHLAARKEPVIRKLWQAPFSRRLANGSPMSVGGRSRGKRRVFPARHDWRRAIHLARFGRKQKTRAQFTSRTSCRRVAGKTSELALGTAAGARTLPRNPSGSGLAHSSGSRCIATLCMTPRPTIAVMRNVRPEDIKGSGRPVIGSSPIDMPMFT